MILQLESLVPRMVPGTEGQLEGSWGGQRNTAEWGKWVKCSGLGGRAVPQKVP